jgi:hypothetical protein
MMCFLVANFEDRVWVVAVNGDSRDVTVVDALTSMIIIEYRCTDNLSIPLMGRFGERTDVFRLSHGMREE